MDQIDRNLIARLQLDGRCSVAALAREIGISRSTVQDRMARLEKTGIIAGYRVVLGEKARDVVSAFVEITIEPAKIAGILSELKAISAVQSVHTVAGKFDLIARIAAPVPADIDNVLDTIGAIPGIQRTASAIVLATKFDRSST